MQVFSNLRPLYRVLGKIFVEERYTRPNLFLDQNIAECESSVLTEQLVAKSCRNQQIDTDQLFLHSDRGPSMTSKTVAQLLADMDVAKSHLRPYQANNNPFFESQFLDDEIALQLP